MNTAVLVLLEYNVSSVSSFLVSSRWPQLLLW